jgi:hypothetical protein
MDKPLKQRKCKGCGEKYIPDRPLQSACGLACSLTVGRKNSAKKARIEYNTQKVKLKTLTDWKNDAQAIFNRFIRIRDGKLCISCQTTNPNIQYAAGHYRTTKAASQLRFNEDNVHAQCNNQCNSQLSGNILEYRINLIKKIGLERVEALENNKSEHRYTIEECKQIIATYKAKIKDLTNE